MIQVPTVPTSQVYTAAPQPNYNAVKIDIHNPQVNAPGYMQNQATLPATAQVVSPASSQAPQQTSQIYGNIPNASVYEVPTQSVYEPQQPAQQPPSATVPPVVPAPVIVPPTIVQTPPVQTQPVAPVVETKPEETAQANIPTTVTNVPTVPEQKVEVKTPEAVTPKLDVNAFIGKLTNPDYEVQASAMESIADLAQNSPQQATELLDVKVVDTLLGIMNTDSSKLTGPTAKQLQIREKIMSGKPVTDAEKVEANKITPMEQSERNKQYAIYTVAILQKLYGSEIEKMNNAVVPLTELPGAAGIVEQIKTNPNPMVRAAGIDALSYIQRPEYKQDLTTLFNVATKDKDTNVQQAAKKALEKLAQVADAPKAVTPAATVATEQPAQVTQPEAKKA